ncbi:uncharacterized protein LOC143627732 [Bidens hawaiensis]|uniref:uncharacterized protein LOC143627732 n=1 Tax=Bidens hawaiensis TaxID=980011 RepID=UPI00404B870D
MPIQAVAPTNQAPARAGYSGPHPLCSTCNYHHPPSFQCRKCTNCGQFGHLTPRCRTAPAAVNQAMVTNPAPPNNNNARACFQCGGLDHFKNNCPQLAPNNNQATRGRAFTIGASDARQDPNVITGTFLLNNHFASILFDTGVERSFISLDFEPLVKWKPAKLDCPYTVELANGNTTQANTIMRDYTLTFDDHSLNIDLIPFKLGSFDLVVGMDWLSRNQAEVACAEKLICIPLQSGETLIIQGEKLDRKLKIISCMKARKLLRKQCYAFLAHVIDKKSKVKKDIPVLKDFPEVFPDDLPGLPPSRQVELRIDLIPGATPIAKAPYRLAPSEMQELSSQLQELLDKGFIRPTLLLTTLTQKGKPFIWEQEQEDAFRTLKQKLCNAPILTLPDGNDDFIVYVMLQINVSVVYSCSEAKS